MLFLTLGVAKHHARSAHHLWNKHHVSQRGTHHSATEKAPFLNYIKNGAFSVSFIYMNDTMCYCKNECAIENEYVH